MISKLIIIAVAIPLTGTIAKTAAVSTIGVATG